MLDMNFLQTEPKKKLYILPQEAVDAHTVNSF